MIGWSESLRTGIVEIDEQHQLLLLKAARVEQDALAGQGREELTTTLAFLGDYAAVHFQTEERYMRAADFPGLEAHRLEHDAITERMADAIEAFRRGGVSEALAAEVGELIGEVLIGHITRADLKMAAHLRRAVAPRKAPA